MNTPSVLIYMAMCTAARWSDPCPGDLARSEHSTTWWSPGPGGPGSRDQAVPRRPPRHTARHEHWHARSSGRPNSGPVNIKCWRSYDLYISVVNCHISENDK